MRVRVNSLYLLLSDSNKMYSRPSFTAISSLMQGAVIVVLRLDESSMYSGTLVPSTSSVLSVSPPKIFSYTQIVESGKP